MPVYFTFVARLSDGLMLVASMDAQYSTSNSAGPKTDAKRLISQLTQSSPKRCTIDASSGSFHYFIDNSGTVVVLAFTDKAYPKRLAFVYLDDVMMQFEDHVVREYEESKGNGSIGNNSYSIQNNNASLSQRRGGKNFSNIISSADRPYAYIKFDKIIQRMRKDFGDPNSKENLTKLKENLNDVQTIVKKNIEDLISRGEQLSEVSFQIFFSSLIFSIYCEIKIQC